MTYLKRKYDYDLRGVHYKRLISLIQELAAAPANIGFFLIEIPKLYQFSGWQKIS